MNDEIAYLEEIIGLLKAELKTFYKSGKLMQKKITVPSTGSVIEFGDPAKLKALIEDYKADLALEMSALEETNDSGNTPGLVRVRWYA